MSAEHLSLIPIDTGKHFKGRIYQQPAHSGYAQITVLFILDRVSMAITHYGCDLSKTRIVIQN